MPTDMTQGATPDAPNGTVTPATASTADGATSGEDAQPAADAAAAPTPATDAAMGNAPATSGSAAPKPDTAKPGVEGEVDESAQGFAALGLGAASLRAIADLGFGAPTPIQLQTIEPLLAGRDVIAQAPTGTGKTAAYGLPIIERLDERLLKPQALIVTPTRELAIQVAEAIHAFGKYREVVTLPIYGGQPYERQFRALARGVQVIVGTPGRLLDHLERKTLDLSAVKTVILDEADEMLNMGFIEDIENILAALPSERQSGLFSATIPPRISRLAEQYLRNPLRFSVDAREAVAPLVRQVYYEAPVYAKPEALARILDLEEPESAIIFVRTRRDADTVAEQLNAMGYLAQAIHGEINQAQRERVLERFRNGHTQLLVATDVAARGLDIPDVSHIINYDLPLDAESYVHRIGRTGRAGQSGEALTLVTPRERRQLQFIEHAIHRRLERLRLPSPADVAARRRAAFREDVLEILDEGQLDPFLALVEDLAGTREPTELAAAAFKMAAQAREASRPGHGMSWYTAPAEPETPERPERPDRPERREPRRWDDIQEASSSPVGGFPGRPRGGPDEGPRPRRDRPERGDRRNADSPMIRLFLRVGRRDGVRPADIVGAIANEAGVPGDAIGDIDLYDTFSFVEAPESLAEPIIAALNRTTIRGREPRVSIARPDDQWQQDGGDERRPAAGAPRPRPWDRDGDDGERHNAPRGAYAARRAPGGPGAFGGGPGRKGAGRTYGARGPRGDRR
ncbi:MAG TPA: DEAD/DEAH box helicase [Ktedonobacterales bacterium]|nr:DEAD/DEAH box helicase [Ktedonobacterales bacterium]